MLYLILGECMKKNLIICLLAALTIQANNATPAERNVEVSKAAEEQVAPATEKSVEVSKITEKDAPSSKEVVAQLRKAHEDLRALRAEMVAILTIVLEELDDLGETRGIDFNAWNNLHNEFDYEKYHEDTEDAEEAEGEQE